MSYKTKNTRHAEKINLVEWRGRIEEKQKQALIDLEQRLHIPASALVRLAIDCFLPKIENMEVTEEGILTVWNRTKF